MKQDPEIKKSLQTPNNNGSTARSLDTQKKKGLFFQQTTDVDLITDIRVSLLAQSPRGGSILLWIILIVFFCALVWAYVAEVEEVTRANGKVVPSRQLQIVQNLEGGILSEVLVNIGDVVKKGQLLLRIDEKRILFRLPLHGHGWLFSVRRPTRVCKLDAGSGSGGNDPWRKIF